MKKLGRVTILTLLIIILSTLLFVACDKDGAKGKQVPIYKGMTISSNFARASATTASDDNGNHYGHLKGDHNNRDDEVDQNKPFEDPNVPSIENKANSTLDVVGAAESIYYADKNQDIFITIKLSNPDSYEILSFTLNGKKYSNYMFEDGSDMENLVLKVNVGNVGGIMEYTIDAIKYVDGTDIKDVRMDGDKTVKAGVRASDQTYVTVTNEQKTMTSISFDAQVVDSYSLIEKSGGYAKAVLYDGETMIAKDVMVGEKASVVFDNLTPNTVYQYGVVALYDDLSGNGVQLNTLYKKAVYTDTIVLFKDVQVGKESIEWGFVWNESFANKQMSAISLWQNGAKVQDVDVNATSVDGLKSNNEYTLKATYKNIQNQDETIAIEFVTYAKVVPAVEIANVQSTQTQVSFELKVTDTDNVGAISKIELLHGNDTPIVATDSAIRSFADLLSNNDYTIRVTYNYDLNDGVGEQQIVKTADIKTKAKATPSVVISNFSSTQNIIECDVAYTDVDNIGNVTEIALYRLENKVKSVPFATHVAFDGLESGKEYKVVVAYKYDLNDGKGVQEVTQTAKRYSAPTFDFVEATCANTNAVSKGDIIYFEAILNNPSGVTIKRIKINDKYYTPSAGTTKTSVIVNIEVEDQFEGGNTDLVVSEIYGMFHEQDISIKVTENNIASVFVNGELSVKSLTIVDEDGNECEMLLANKQYYYIVSFGNKTGYSIDSIKIIDCKEEERQCPEAYGGTSIITYTDYTMLDNETAKIPVRFSTGFRNPYVNEVSYSNASVGSKKKDKLIVSIPQTMCLQNETPIVISSAEQLKNMQGWNYYVLEEDIDLAGIEWKNPQNFEGYFDGQNHIIKNMNYVGNADTPFEWGLFNRATGIIKNLKLNGRLIVTTNGKNATVGGLCVGAPELIIDNVMSDINLSVDSKSGFASVGGLVGEVSYDYLLTINNSCNIGAVTSDDYAGGLVGYSVGCWSVSIFNSYNIGSITGGASAGGLVGYVESGEIFVSNCYNAGSVSGSYASGFLGYIYYSDSIQIENSYSTGSVEGPAFVTGYFNTLEITDSYYTAGENSYGEKKTLAEIIEIMKTIWDSTIWDFDNLDENGNPTLK